MFVPRALSQEKQQSVRVLLDQELSDDEISRRTGVGRATVRRWRRRGFPAPVSRGPPRPGAWGSKRRRSYSYLLGLYLGDGYVASMSHTASFVVACDAQYTDLVEECVNAVNVFAPRPPALHQPTGTKGVRVVSYWSGWKILFPQHAPGKKHERKIELDRWQQEIVDAYPREFLRGMIHSDGSRCLNTFTVKLKHGPREYSYPRYFFTNYSEDIREIFCSVCDRMGIRWSQSNWRNISISHRKSVARLDQFIGPKS